MTGYLKLVASLVYFISRFVFIGADTVGDRLHGGIVGDVLGTFYGLDLRRRGGVLPCGTSS
jgi:hypothetical protein